MKKPVMESESKPGEGKLAKLAFDVLNKKFPGMKAFAVVIRVSDDKHENCTINVGLHGEFDESHAAQMVLALETAITRGYVVHGYVPKGHDSPDAPAIV